MSSKNLGEFNELLSDHGFLRVHKSHLVNKSYIKTFLNEGIVVMQDDARVEVSRRKMADLKKVLRKAS
jgi:two-component system LytT family response regulator